MKQDSELSVFAFPISPPHPAIEEEKLELFKSTSTVTETATETATATATAKVVAAVGRESPAAAMAMAMAAPGRLPGRTRPNRVLWGFYLKVPFWPPHVHLN